MTPPSNPVIGGVEDRRHHQNPIYNAPRPPTVIQTPQGSINMPIHVLPKKDIDREDGRRRDNDRWHDGDRDDNRWRERDRDRWNDRWGTTVDWWRFNPTNFNYRSCSYRSYRNTYVTGSCYINPFGYYYGYCPPFINTYDCSYRPPVVIVIDQPIYQDNVFTGFQDTGTQDYSNDPYIEQTAPGLSNVTDDLVQTFGDGNMEGISDLVDPNTSIQVYQRGVYKYTIKSSEYLNLTRDAVNAIDPVEFVVQDVHAVSDGNYSISGKQTYRDKNGNQQTMFLSFVVTNSYGRWVITQIGTSPEEYHDLTTPY